MTDDLVQTYGRVVNFGHKPGVYINGKFSRDLPETKFWEGDHVLVYRDQGLGSDIIPTDVSTKPKGKEFAYRLMVIDIKWGWKRDDKPWFYMVSDDFKVGWHTHAEEPDMELLERGDVWKYFHDERPVFDSI